MKTNNSKYNKSEIMKSAWWSYRNDPRYWKYGHTFGEALKEAWASAKAKIAHDALMESMRQAAAAKAARVFSGMVRIGWGRNQILVNVYNGDVDGNTYPWRREIKECGGQWNPMERNWEFTPDQAQEFCRRYAD